MLAPSAAYGVKHLLYAFIFAQYTSEWFVVCVNFELSTKNIYCYRWEESTRRSLLGWTFRRSLCETNDSNIPHKTPIFLYIKNIYVAEWF